MPTDQAREALDRPISCARRCRIPAFVNLQKFIVAHTQSILAAIERGRSNGRTESVNTKIRLITRIAFGFKSPGRTHHPGHDQPRRSPPRPSEQEMTHGRSRSQIIPRFTRQPDGHGAHVQRPRSGLPAPGSHHDLQRGPFSSSAFSELSKFSFQPMTVRGRRSNPIGVASAYPDRMDTRPAWPPRRAWRPERREPRRDADAGSKCTAPLPSSIPLHYCG